MDTAYEMALQLLRRGYAPVCIPTKQDGIPTVSIYGARAEHYGEYLLSDDRNIRIAATLGMMVAVHQKLSNEGLTPA